MELHCEIYTQLNQNKEPIYPDNFLGNYEHAEMFRAIRLDNFLNDEEILIKSSFNGAFFMLRLQDLMELGYPPINEGISDESVEDWYYTRQLKVRNWKVATINRCLHLGYNTSIRESL